MQMPWSKHVVRSIASRLPTCNMSCGCSILLSRLDFGRGELKGYRRIDLAVLDLSQGWRTAEIV